MARLFYSSARFLSSRNLIVENFDLQRKNGVRPGFFLLPGAWVKRLEIRVDWGEGQK